MFFSQQLLERYTLWSLDQKVWHFLVCLFFFFWFDTQTKKKKTILIIIIRLAGIFVAQHIYKINRNAYCNLVDAWPLFWMCFTNSFRPFVVHGMLGLCGPTEHLEEFHLLYYTDRCTDGKLTCPLRSRYSAYFFRYFDDFRYWYVLAQKLTLSKRSRIGLPFRPLPYNVFLFWKVVIRKNINLKNLDREFC